MSLLTRKMSSYFEMDGGDLSVRTTFWRGVIAGGILGAAVSMMATGGIQRQGKKASWDTPPGAETGPTG